MDYSSTSTSRPKLDYAGAVSKTQFPAPNNSRNINLTSNWRQTTTSNNNNKTINPLSTSQKTNANENQDKQTNSKSNQAENNNYKPSRKLAIVLENAQNVTQHKCLRAVADLIGGRSIQYCTRLSGGRICLYLTSENKVEEMCEHGGVIIECEFLPCRRYISEAKKFVISNCPPELEDEDLKKLLEPYGQIVSAPARLKVSTTDDDLKHIKTWRRSIYILLPDNAPEMPKRMVITSKPDGVKYTLYIDNDEIICSYCARPGHTAEKCKKKTEMMSDFPELNTFTMASSVSSRLIPRRTPESLPSNSKDSQVDLMPKFSLLDSIPPVTATEVSETNGKSVKDYLSNSETLCDAATSNLTNMTSIWGDKIIERESQNQSLLSNSLPPSSDEMEVDENLTKELTSNEILESFNTNKQNIKRLLSPETSNSQAKSSNQKKSRTEEDDFTSDGESSISSLQSNQSKASKSSKKTEKKKKKEDSAIAELLPTMNFTDSDLSEEMFKKFLAEARGHQNSKMIAEKYKLSLPSLINKLLDAMSKCKNFNLQRRLDRAYNALSQE